MLSAHDKVENWLPTETPLIRTRKLQAEPRFPKFSPFECTRDCCRWRRTFTGQIGKDKPAVKAGVIAANALAFPLRRDLYRTEEGKLTFCNTGKFAKTVFQKRFFSVYENKWVC